MLCAIETVSFLLVHDSKPIYEAKCAHHLPNPVRRRDPRYLPPNKNRFDARLTAMPLRRKLIARAQSPPERSASGSVSPRKDGPDDIDDDEFDNMLAPASMRIDLEEAKRVTSYFRSSCLNRATCCAVSGEGEPWRPGPPIGPAVQACHVVPQQHYQLYPSAASGQDAKVRRAGDPAKRPQPAQFDHSQGGAAGEDKTEKGVVGRGERLQTETDMLEGYITPRNNREFLAHVNKKLQRYKG
ncbi:hypothetical protein B0T10DRAFT_590953 [Thelonectria olida]|uniref:Uncharacterized protein n=1 Tax=Thelonectria olida TaxID=1576542 RepID=A0A9P9AIU6_9HYPO|nr:hypothetical protein B0T10DRAFT_590953 [Thelonectria olida]